MKTGFLNSRIICRIPPISERSQRHRTNALEQVLPPLKTNSDEEIILLLPSLTFEISSGYTTLLHFPFERLPSLVMGCFLFSGNSLPILVF